MSMIVGSYVRMKAEGRRCFADFVIHSLIDLKEATFQGFRIMGKYLFAV